MNVRELIEILQNYNPELVMTTYHHGEDIELKEDAITEHLSGNALEIG